MILRSIEVEGWRCFASSVHVGPFVDGLNVIHGPNGIGKSSLMMALARGLFDSHNVGGADIKTLRPWGRELAPKVTIEFEQSGDQFQLHKQFLDSASAKLSRRENGKYIPVAESRAADDRAREILSGDASGRGVSDQRHWGLAQILWATQGSLKIDQLAPGTRATIQDALGAQIAGTGTEVLEDRIADNYGQFFTPTGKIRSGASAPAIVGLESQLVKEKADRAEYQQRLQEFDDASRRIEDLRLQTATARHNEQELNEKLKDTREQVQAYQKLVSQQKQHDLEVSAAKESYLNLADRIESIRVAVKELSATSGQLKQLREDLPAQEKLVVQSQEEAKTADERVKEIRGRRSEITAARQLAQLAERYARNRENLLELEKRITQLDETQNLIEKLRKSREPIVAPDKKTLKKIAKIARQRDDARLKLDAALITVTIKLESDTEVEITNAEETGLRKIAKDETHEIKGAPDVALHLPGVGQFQATGPTDDFEELRGQWESAVTAFDELAAGFGTSDVASLDALHAQADELDQQMVQADIKLNTLLDGENVDTLRGDRSLTKSKLEEIHSDHSDWRDSPPVPAELSRQADETGKNIESEIEKADSERERAKEALRMGSEKRNGLESDIKNIETQAATLEKQLESLRNDGLEDKTRTEKLTEVALQRDAAQGKLVQVEKQIEKFGEDPTKSLAMLEEQQKAFRTEADDAERKLNTESGRLQQIISEAPYSSLVAVEEEISRLEHDIAGHRLQIDAIRLLHDSVKQQKSDVMQSLIDPIRLRANIILQRISGSRFDGVHFDETLLPTGIAPRSNDEAVSLNQISGGEQEQVHFAVRMALAEVAFPTGRQLVVLDDVFTYTDTPRLARIATILDESAERFQIVLLTCHPERYRGLPNAKFFDLENIASSSEQ